MAADTLPRQGTQFVLGNTEPTAVFGRVAEFDASDQLPRTGTTSSDVRSSATWKKIHLERVVVSIGSYFFIQGKSDHICVEIIENRA